MVSFGIKKTIVYSLLPVVVLLPLLEVGCRVVEIWLPPWKVDYGWGFSADSRLFVPDTGVPGTMITAPPKRICFKEQVFVLPKASRNFRIFVVGGSSVNYAEHFINSLGTRLNLLSLGKYEFELINAGGCGYGSHRLVPIVAEVLEYEPDLILFYSGHNEFQEIEQLRFVELRTLPLQKVLYKSALCRFIRDRFASLQLTRLRRERNQQLLRMTPKDNGSWEEKHFSQEQIDERMRIYEQNLGMIVSLCKAKKVPIVLSTVPSNLWEPRLDDEEALKHIRTLYARGQYEEGKACAQEALKKYGRYQACETENSIIRRLAHENGVPLADVEAKVIAAEPHQVPGETLFNDWCHLNPIGNVWMMAAFQEQIVALLRTPE